MRNLNLYLKVKNFAGLIKLFIKVGVLFQGILVFIREGEWDGGSEAFFQYFYNGNLSMGMGGGSGPQNLFICAWSYSFWYTSLFSSCTNFKDHCDRNSSLT